MRSTQRCGASDVPPRLSLWANRCSTSCLIAVVPAYRDSDPEGRRDALEDEGRIKQERLAIQSDLDRRP